MLNFVEQAKARSGSVFFRDFFQNRDSTRRFLGLLMRDRFLPGFQGSQRHIGIGGCVRLLPPHEDPYHFGSLVLSPTGYSGGNGRGWDGPGYWGLSVLRNDFFSAWLHCRWDSPGVCTCPSVRGCPLVNDRDRPSTFHEGQSKECENCHGYVYVDNIGVLAASRSTAEEVSLPKVSRSVIPK